MYICVDEIHDVKHCFVILKMNSSFLKLNYLEMGVPS